MSGLAELALRHQRLQDISGIVTAMKSLSLVETRKLARFVGHQRRMLANIEDAAADFLRLHPEFGVAPGGTDGPALLVLIGSERGFCGGFNERVVHALQRQDAAVRTAALVVVGRRLHSRLPSGARVAAELDGATVAEDVPAVLDRVLDALRGLRSGATAAPSSLLCLGHDADGETALTQLLPLPRPAAQRAPGAAAPRLQLPAADFHAALLDQYLLAALRGHLAGSLAAESHQRLAHMDHALDRLDTTLLELTRRRNALRQERIVEEIEVMLSSATAAP